MKCRLCGSKDIFKIQTKIRNLNTDAVSVFGCRECGVQYLHPFPNESDLAAYYSDCYREEYETQQFYNKDVLDQFHEEQLPEATVRVERVRSFLSADDDILEIGCATGYFLKSAQPYVKGVYGAEWDTRNGEYAGALGIDVRKNPDDHGKKFDKIFMYHVLEHISDPIDYMRRLKSCVSDEGTVFVEVPNNQDALLKIYDLQEFKDFYYCSAHLWYFNPSSLAYVMKNAGYDVQMVPVQRYDVSNHLYWLKNRKPGGQGFYDGAFTEDLKSAYEGSLVSSGNTDTIFAMCK